MLGIANVLLQRWTGSAALLHVIMAPLAVAL
jgi:hypothetical protein